MRGKAGRTIWEPSGSMAGHTRSKGQAAVRRFRRPPAWSWFHSLFADRLWRGGFSMPAVFSGRLTPGEPWLAGPWRQARSAVSFARPRDESAVAGHSRP
jgi:hypothetical protein